MSAIEKYILLIRRFVTGEIIGSQFETSYLEMFKRETSEFPEHVYKALNDLFLDVDSYCGDPALRDDEDLSEEELLLSARKTLERLK